MIAYIKGIVTEKSPTRVVLEAAGVGYELLIPVSTYEKLPREGGEMKLLTAHIVREDDEILFGFASSDEKELFSKLTAVSGVGPKLALTVLSGASLRELAMSIASGDAKRLASIKGIGKKTAEKICVELKDRISVLEARSFGGVEDVGASGLVVDSVAALRALGFNEETSSKLVADVLAKNPSLESVEKVIRLALASR